MNRNQIIVVVLIAVFGAGVYLFAPTTKPKEEKPADTHEHAHEEVLDIEGYIAEVNAKIADQTTREKVEQLTQSKSYKELLTEYQQLDKPIAMAYYVVKLAEKENKAEAYAGAGDFNAMLLQTAPDTKARNFLSGNALTCYQKAVNLDSSNTENHLRLANAYMSMSDGGAPMQGVSILLDIVRKDSNNIDALLMLGRFGIVSGQYDKAIGRLEKILYLRPQNTEALLLLAEAYHGQGNKIKAVEMLEKCKAAVDDPEAKREIDKYIEEIKKPNG